MQETVARIPASETVLHVTRDELGSAAPDTAPVGIIFHVARCGSTLISQSLKHLDNLVVYAEPQPVNEILVPPHRWPRADLVAALRTLGDAFARHAGRPYVLKLSSWNTLFCDIVTEAFPETNWVLSLRDPVEVGVSLLRQPPGWLQRHDGGVARPDRDRGAGGCARSHPKSAWHAPMARSARRRHASTRDAADSLTMRRCRPPCGTWWPRTFRSRSTHGSERKSRRPRACMRRRRSEAAAEFAPDAAAKQAAASAELRRAIDSLRASAARAPRQTSRWVIAGVRASALATARSDPASRSSQSMPLASSRDARAVRIGRICALTAGPYSCSGAFE